MGRGRGNRGEGERYPGQTTHHVTLRGKSRENKTANRPLHAGGNRGRALASLIWYSLQSSLTNEAQSHDNPHRHGDSWR